MFVVWFSLPTHVSSAPAGVDEFPVAVVDFDGVPGVACTLRRQRVPWLQGRETEAFAVAADDYAFQPGFGSEGSKKPGIAFADCEAGMQG